MTENDTPDDAEKIVRIARAGARVMAASDLLYRAQMDLATLVERDHDALTTLRRALQSTQQAQSKMQLIERWLLKL